MGKSRKNSGEAVQLVPRVVVVGGGFAGIQAVKSLRRSAVEIVLVDRQNYHLFQPLLYQVATGGLSPADIATPLRYIFKRQKNVRVLRDEVVDIDVEDHEVITKHTRIHYDYLVVTTGAKNHYFGNDHWEEHALGLKSLEEALEIRRRVFLAFEDAECLGQISAEMETIRFVVVGGGPTGVELAGAIGELSAHTFRGEFHNIDPAKAEILLIETGERILPNYPKALSIHARRDLERLGVEVYTKTLVSKIDECGVTLQHDHGEEWIPAQAVFWAAGVQASDLGKKLAEKVGVELDKSGRVRVQADLSITNYPNIFVAGDLASSLDESIDQPLPGVAPVAMQEGKYVGQKINALVRGKNRPPFRYRHRGTLAVIGRAAAVADLGRIQLRGYMAWLVWLFVHLMNLVEFENRLLVLIQWGWNYLTRNRSARLITSTSHLARKSEPESPLGKENLPK